MTLVVDASAVAAALGVRKGHGDWARSTLAATDLAAPHIMPAEVANILRRAVIVGDMSADSASLAHGELLDMRVELFAYEPLAWRVWELRDNLSTYDAWYVALAESLDVSLVTLDLRMAGASGPRCQFRVPRAPDTLETGME